MAMADAVRRIGYVVYQETAEASGAEFYETRAHAEMYARGMLAEGVPVIVVRAVRFTTAEIEGKRP